MNEIEQKYFEKLQASRKEAWKVFSDDEYIGVMRSVIDKYTESAHFVYELLQNADDALATKAEFRLSKKDCILFIMDQLDFPYLILTIKLKTRAREIWAI